MKFSRFKNQFFVLSILGIVALFAITYGHFGGFERSISFDGGVRLTIQLPENMDREDLLRAADKAGLPDASARIVDFKRNQYDLEFGPDVQDRIKAEIKDYETKYRQEAEKAALEDQEIAPMESRTVPGEIEKLILPELGISEEDVISKAAISPSYGQELFETAL